MPARWDETSTLTESVLRGDSRAIARTISLVENQVPRARELIRALFPSTGKARVLGITGSPGAGKSTLVDQVALSFANQGKKVGIIAVDPSSPFSGGAILGDRIRMMRASEHDHIFIRSMASRGTLGGLAQATFDAVQVLDAGGYDLVVIETVGVGQGEVDIARLADTCMVVLVPGMGDGVQALKAGILEIADLFVVNKSDREGADLLVKELRTLMTLDERSKDDWLPPIIETVATTGTGIEKLSAEVWRHRDWLTHSTKGASRQKLIITHTILGFLSTAIRERFLNEDKGLLEHHVDLCLKKTLDPGAAAQALMKTTTPISKEH